MHRLRFRGPDTQLPIRAGDAISAYNGQIYGQFAPGGYCGIEDGLEREVEALRGGDADGMYAYSRYTGDAGALVLATDPHFIKPMFFRREGAAIGFCSELAPLLKLGGRPRVHSGALAELFAYGWYLSDQTWVRDAFLAWKNDVEVRDGMVRLHPKNGALAPPAPRGDAGMLRERIRTSVARSTLGIGPLGLALSGGLDSTILAYELNALGVEDLTCVTVRANGADDGLESLAELGLPEGVWRGWKHVVIPIDDADFLDAFESAAHAFGQPTTMSSLALYQRLADGAAEAGVRALILGEGVDEYFAGYASYAKVRGGAELNYYRHPPRDAIVNALFGKSAADAVRDRFGQLYAGAADLRTIEVQMRLTRLLLRSDLCLMSRSIEGRVPFLHNGIPAVAMSIPWQELSRAPGKTALREVYADDLGPRAHGPKVRFKTSDDMLMRCLARAPLHRRIVAAAGAVLDADRVDEALGLLSRPDSFDADCACLLMSLTFLIENGAADGDRG
ncbi:MAG TPA: asparagine synthase-related protein [Allosphingosinicella sp.]